MGSGLKPIAKNLIFWAFLKRQFQARHFRQEIDKGLQLRTNGKCGHKNDSLARYTLKQHLCRKVKSIIMSAMSALSWENNKFVFLAALTAVTCLGIYVSGALIDEATKLLLKIFWPETFELHSQTIEAGDNLKTHLYTLIKWTPIWLVGYFLIRKIKRYALLLLLFFGGAVNFANYYVFYYLSPKYLTRKYDPAMSAYEALMPASFLGIYGILTALVIFLVWKLFRLQ